MADDGVIMARGRRLRVHRASRVDATGVASTVNLACFAAAPIREATRDQDPRLLIQRQIRDGRLPRDRAATIFGAPGVGGCCDGCDTPLETTQLVMSVPWPSKKTFAHLRADCCQLWKAVEDDAMTESRPECCCCGVRAAGSVQLIKFCPVRSPASSSPPSSTPPTPPAALGATACAPSRCPSRSWASAPFRSCRRSPASLSRRTESMADRSPGGRCHRCPRRGWRERCVSADPSPHGFAASVLTLGRRGDIARR